MWLLPVLAAAVGALLAIPGSAPLRAQTSLPDASGLFAAARENLARSGRVQDQYAYKERRTQLHTNPFGRLGTGGTLLYEVTPLGPGAGFSRQLLERDGEPVQNGEVRRFNQRRNRDRAQSSSAVDDAASVLEYAIDRRETIGGRPVVIVKFSPKRGARARTREGRIAHAFKGQIWVDEGAQEVMRVEAAAIETISYGMGLIARLGEGTRVTVVRERFDDVWLPVSIRFTGEGRAMLLRKFSIDFRVEWFDYRKLPASMDAS